MQFVDFFAGIGGIRLGLEQAGHKCVGFCEFDKYARTAYKAMYDYVRYGRRVGKPRCTNS